MPKTKVLFRKYDGGKIVALFPRIASSSDSKYCHCYHDAGYHGAEIPEKVIGATVPANRKEFSKVQRELVKLGYKLRIAARMHPKDKDYRERELDV